MTQMTLISSNTKDIQSFSALLGKPISHVLFNDLDDVHKSAELIEKANLIICSLSTKNKQFNQLFHYFQSKHPLKRQLFIVEAGEKESIYKNHQVKSFNMTILERPMPKSILLDAIDNPIMTPFQLDAITPTPVLQDPKATKQLAQQQINNIVLEKEISRGGTGIVYLGYQKTLQRQVAIKVLRPENLKEKAENQRLKQEALAISKLKSPHIVQCFDAGFLQNNEFYIVMEFVSGGNLETYFKQNHPLSELEIIDLMLQTAKGLEAAHEEGIIHRDIKPSNLLLNKKKQIIITDFGLALADGFGRSTQSGMVVGTPSYLSPEQATDAPIDHRTDIYSLGVVFYELLTGQLPVSRNNVFDAVLERIKMETLDPSKKKPDLPDDLVGIVKKMTARKPQERFESCLPLIHALEVARFQRSFYEQLEHYPEFAELAKMPDISFRQTPSGLIPFATPLPKSGQLASLSPTPTPIERPSQKSVAKPPPQKELSQTPPPVGKERDITATHSPIGQEKKTSPQFSRKAMDALFEKALNTKKQTNKQPVISQKQPSKEDSFATTVDHGNKKNTSGEERLEHQQLCHALQKAIPEHLICTLFDIKTEKSSQIGQSLTPTNREWLEYVELISPMFLPSFKDGFGAKTATGVTKEEVEEMLFRAFGNLHLIRKVSETQLILVVVPNQVQKGVLLAKTYWALRQIKRLV